MRTAITSTKRRMSISFAGTTKYNFSLKTFPHTYNPRADCFSTSYFQRCLQVMPIAVLAVLAALAVLAVLAALAVLDVLAVLGQPK